METESDQIQRKVFPSQEPDENIVLFKRKHWFLFLMIFLILLGMLLLPAIAITISIKYYPIFFQGSVINILVILASMYLLFLCGAGLLSFINLYFDIFLLTNKRIIDINQKGLFHRSIDELDLLHVEDVSSKVTGIFGTFFDFGTVEIQTAGTVRNFIFQGVPHPRAICRKILSEYKKTLEFEQVETAAKIDQAEGLGGRIKRPLTHEERHGRPIKSRSSISPILDQKIPKQIEAELAEFPKKIEGDLKEGETVNLGGASFQEGDSKILIKFNIMKSRLDEALKILPSLRSPTVSELADKYFVAVESVVEKNELEDLIPKLKHKGATDIIESDIKEL